MGHLALEAACLYAWLSDGIGRRELEIAKSGGLKLGTQTMTANMWTFAQKIHQQMV